DARAAEIALLPLPQLPSVCGVRGHPVSNQEPPGGRLNTSGACRRQIKKLSTGTRTASHWLALLFRCLIRGSLADHDLKRVALGNQQVATLPHHERLGHMHAAVLQWLPPRVVLFRLIEMASQSVSLVRLFVGVRDAPPNRELPRIEWQSC